ncbi:hypothetical protein GQ55_2G385400 [Panicum hallii var. hallii]|uniref:Uncharacterized protein n=1 Tax=Panicum hallii var. hallii TaxID=1504633 RepID=A0A2T7EWZ0_9POAL|nr:hypothetical protein GQ55_2G385400 [Panicum hallii var. hallii]
MCIGKNAPRGNNLSSLGHRCFILLCNLHLQLRAGLPATVTGASPTGSMAGEKLTELVVL